MSMRLATYSLLRSSVLLPVLLTLFWACVSAAEPVDYDREIRPLLSDRCFLCHGPDAGQRASELRLDQQESAHSLAIKPGDSASSELMRRIMSQDADEVMPPPDSNLELSTAEKERLKRWIDEGAGYALHWAFVTPRRRSPPEVQQADWPRGELDRWVLRKLEQEHLAPSGQASAETLIRRVTLDLTGLPPTVGEIDAFLADAHQDLDTAYERLVDRLLASQRYGERMAVDWLDVARYADTYGYQNDRYRAMWPWRDWVVRAFNQNLPYDQFITWQLAGDLLPQATREQILATAFNRNHRQTNEGGSVDEEFRAEYVADRVNTFGAAFLGLTLECCRCHDHKYDPLTQREYYQLSAFFNSIDESGLYSHFTNATPTPALSLASQTEQQELQAVNESIESLEKKIAAWQPNPVQFQTWRQSLEDVRQSTDALLKSPMPYRQQLAKLLTTAAGEAKIGDFSLEEIQQGTVHNAVDATAPAKTAEEPQIVPGKIGNALHLNGENNITMRAGADFTRNQPFTISLWLKTPKRFERAVVFHRSRAWTDSGSRGYELLIEDGRLSAALVHFWPGDAIRVVSRTDLPIDTWTHVAVRYDGSSRAEGLSLIVNGELAEVQIVRDHLTRHILGSDGASGGDVSELTFGQRFRDIGFKDGEIDEIKVFQRDLTDLELRMLYLRDASPANCAEVIHNANSAALQAFFAVSQPDRMGLLEDLLQLRQKRSQIGDSIAQIMVMQETPTPRPTYVLTRGAYDAPGELVGRGLPASILPRVLPATASRLELAGWLVDPQHPLTARVAVNRFWQSLFGIGLVRTSEDFGLQGSAPSHPELLDALSVDFIESGWDVKRLLKNIVMSASYRQESNPKQQLLELDPENRLLARGPSGRLAAELIRDGALAASGLLVESIGGAPVKPYQPDGLWEEKSGLKYQRDANEGSHRRSLYTYWKRTSPPPAMMTLDASNREVCAVRRQVTMTPLQTLVLLNDPQYVEAARALAERAVQASASQPERAVFIFRSLTARQPSAQETNLLVSMFRKQRQRFSENTAAQADWLAIGDHKPSQSLDPLDLSAWSAVASGLMSFDETVMKR